MLSNRIINPEEIHIYDKDLVIRLFGISRSEMIPKSENWTAVITAVSYCGIHGVSVDQRKVRILGPESSPENINCFDDQWTIIR